MTMWELAVCVDGVNRSNSPEEELTPPTDEEFEKMLEDYDHLRATVN
jgi:hypothetical protein